MEQGTQKMKPLVYQGITLYNPNDYLHLKSDPQHDISVQESPQKFSSTILIPKKKHRRRSRTKKEHDQDREDDTKNNNVIRTRSKSKTRTKSKVKKERDKKNVIKNSTHPFSTSIGNNNVHYSISGTQMLADEGFDYFDISLYNFPTTPNFGAYLSGYFKEKDARFRIRAKFGRRILRPNYRLGKLPTHKRIQNKKRVPVFLFEADYNSELELKLAEIEEARRGHPPGKRAKFELSSGSEDILVIEDENSEGSEIDKNYSNITISSGGTSTTSSATTPQYSEDCSTKPLSDANGESFHSKMTNVNSSLTQSEYNLVQQVGSKRTEFQKDASKPMDSSSSEDNSQEQYSSISESEEDSESSIKSSHNLILDTKTSKDTEKETQQPDENGNTNTNPVSALSIAKNKDSVFKIIFGIFMKKDNHSESRIMNPINPNPKRNFFQKLFRISSHGVTKPLPIMDPPSNNHSIIECDQAKKDDALTSELENPLGPKHTDSLSLMRKKRLKFFAEAQAFYQDSIKAYRSAIMCQEGSASPLTFALTSTPPLCQSPPTRTDTGLMALNKNKGLLSPLHLPPSNLCFGYNSTVSESVITPAISRRKRRIYQNLMDELEDIKNNNPPSTKQVNKKKGQHSEKTRRPIQLKGILKNK